MSGSVKGGGSYGVVYTLVDKATKEIERINRSIAGARAPIDRAQKSMSKFTEVSGLRSLGQGLSSVAGIAKDAAVAVGSIAAPLGALVGGASIAGFARMAMNFAQVGQGITNAGFRATISAVKMEEWQNTMVLMGQSAEAGTRAITGVSDAVNNMRWGQNPQLAGLFQRFGLETRQANGDVLNLEQSMSAFWNIVNAQRGPRRGQQISEVIKLFGFGPEMEIAVRRGEQWFRAQQEAAKQLAVMTPEAVRRADALTDAQGRLSANVQQFTKMIGFETAPAFAELLDYFTELIAANGKWIAQDIGAALRDFTGWIKGVNWKEVGTDIERIWRNVDSVVQSLGGWKTVAIGLIGVMGASWVASMIAPFVSIGMAMAAIGLLSPAGAAILGITLLAANAFTEGNAPPKTAPPPPPEGAAPGEWRIEGAGGRGGGAHRVWHPWAPGEEPTAGGPRRNARGINSPLSNIVPGGVGTTRGEQNRNRMNLSYVEGQSGVLGREAGANHQFGVFGSDEEGMAASLRQLQLSQGRGYTSVQQLVDNWTREPGPQTDAYAADVAKSIGIRPNDRPNLNDPAQAAAFLKSASAHESRAPDDATIARGVAMVLGNTAGAPVNINGGTAASTVITQPAELVAKGSVAISVNVPAQVTAHSTGIFDGPPPVLQSAMGAH